MKWTYRKVKNKGFTPCWYHSDRGMMIAWVERQGPKWMSVRFNHSGQRRRLPVSELRYFTPLKSKRG